MARRTQAGVYSVDEKPNLVAKMQVLLLAADISTWREFEQERLGPDHPMLLEMAARWVGGQYENSRQRIAAEDADRAAWALYRFFKEVLKLNVDEMEREARRARWWR